MIQMELINALRYMCKLKSTQIDILSMGLINILTMGPIHILAMWSRNK